MKVRVKVVLKEGILDPQGKAVYHTLNDLKFKGVNDVRIGKYIELTFNDITRAEVEKETREICQKLLANPVMENFEFEIEEK
ncbi:MAG: phosphoribosylformylglycinamidine synthase subunit PurS [Calditrichales bacterium]|nr:MAG: phosphoribosylformylglycinamidine synthase subunit PurS [Calditrichales bacterium]